MKKLISLLAFFCLLQACTTAQQAGIQSLKVADFEKTINQYPDAQLLDVRTKQEYSQGYIQGAINYDFYENDFREKLTFLDKEKAVLVYCATGNRSMKTAILLKDLGFKTIVNLDGGFTAWQKAKRNNKL